MSKMVKILKSLLLVNLFFISLNANEDKLLESQPQILFEHKNLMTQENKVSLQIKFNNAVLYMEQGHYLTAIKLFKQTQQLIKVPSFLNIGIAWYKLNSLNNAYLYLKKIFDVKEAATEDPFSYMSAAYYLYKITKDRMFIDEIIKIASKQRRLDEPTKRLVVDVYIELKKYDDALKILKDMKYPDKLKEALLYVKLKQWDFATINLDLSLANATTDNLINKILWIKLFVDLKSNNFVKLQDDVDKIEKRRKIFTMHFEMPIKLYFNQNKFGPKEYFDKITKFDMKRKIDFVFYFAPYIFIDKDALTFEEEKAFLLKNNSDLSTLDTMINYNKDFVKLIKLDPIQRAFMLQKKLDEKYDSSSYEYYNLGLCYAQIDNFNKAYKYFHKAYNLNKGNKLFAVMTLLSADRISEHIPKQERESIEKSILSQDGFYKLFGKYIYKVIYKDDLNIDKVNVKDTYIKTIFFRALYFLNHVNKTGIKSDEPLLVEFDKDPLVYLFKLIARQNGENDYQYISRIQDEIPKEYNNMFIKGPLIIVRYYIQMLKAIGMFHTTSINIQNDASATYYRTKALVDLYNGKPQDTIRLINSLQKDYQIDDRYTYLLLIAAMIDSGQINDALLTMSLAQQELGRDHDIDFLIGLNLLGELKIASALKYLQNKYDDDLIDFYLDGFDKLLQDI